MTRLLGIDLGERRIGLAVGDDSSGSVRPLVTIRRAAPQRDAETLRRLVDEQAIDELVVGLPLNMDGSEGAQAAATRRWADEIGRLLGVPFQLRDERLTSENAERALGRPVRGRSGGPPSAAGRARRRARVDREAAAIVVRLELDARSETRR